MSNEDIANHLVVSAHTTKTHVNRAMTKLSAHDRAQLVIAAYETGLVQPVKPNAPTKPTTYSTFVFAVSTQRAGPAHRSTRPGGRIVASKPLNGTGFRF
jgi:hypothetical protein